MSIVLFRWCKSSLKQSTHILDINFASPTLHHILRKFMHNMMTKHLLLPIIVHSIINPSLLPEEIVSKMLVAEHTLHNRYHITKIERITNSNNRHLHSSISKTNHRKKHILNNRWPTPIHLLHKLPHPLVNYKIILSLLDITPKVILMIHQFTIINTS